MTAATGAVGTDRADLGGAVAAWARRNAWTIGLLGLLVLMLIVTKLIQPNYGAPQLTGLAIAVLPVAFAAVAQAIVVISGGIDLSVASIMTLASVTVAVLMKDQSPEFALLAVLSALVLGMIVGAANGAIIVVTRVPDIVVTLAMSFVWAGAALLILSTPGGGAADWFKGLVNGNVGVVNWMPRAFVTLVVVVAVI